MISREKIFNYVKEKYEAEPDYPWKKTPDSAVLRHKKSRKWFGLLMDVQECRLGLPGEDMVPILNLKCEPMLIGSLRNQPGVFPAYHMNKEHWITILLSGSLSEEEVCNLIDLSYELTK